MAPKQAPALPEVNVSDHDGVRCLHLGSLWIQGAMRVKQPFALELDYVQRMMVWLLFYPRAAVSGKRAMQLGLGAAALTKFCCTKMRLHTTAIEINPQVVKVCQDWFKLPAHHPKLQVVVADAAQEIQKPEYLGTVDVLQVDLYDHEAAAPVLDTADFYQHCRQLLTPDGMMTVNLFGRDASYPASLEKIKAAFGSQAVWAFRPTREGNTVVAAQRQASRPDRALLQERAQAIASHWDLPAAKWLRLFKPVEA